MRNRYIALMVATALALTSFGSGPATGENTASVPFMDTSRPTKTVELDVHVGEGMSTIMQNYGDAIPDVGDFTLTPGSLTALGFGAELPIRNYLAVGTGLDFAINNYYYSMTILHPEAGTLNTLYTRNHFYNIDIPLYMSLRFNLGNRVRWHNEIGAYISIGAGGKSKTKAYTSSTNQIGQSQVTETSYERDYFNADDPIINAVRSTDWGLHLATGIVVNRHIMLKCVMHAGVHNLAKNFGVLNVKNRTLNVVFKAGYVF